MTRGYKGRLHGPVDRDAPGTEQTRWVTRPCSWPGTSKVPVIKSPDRVQRALCLPMGSLER
ncbi:MAG: hypothetical protein MZU95_14195 [Desulfomicrobium escambiense]|nr:hypothetical protein [Desulfomicrobium escambiense]